MGTDVTKYVCMKVPYIHKTFPYSVEIANATGLQGDVFASSDEVSNSNVWSIMGYDEDIMYTSSIVIPSID